MVSSTIFLASLVASQLGLGHGVLHVGAGLNLGFVLQRLHQLLAGFGGSQVCYGFELALHAVQLLVSFALLFFELGQLASSWSVRRFSAWLSSLSRSCWVVGLVFLAGLFQVYFLALQLLRAGAAWFR